MTNDLLAAIVTLSVVVTNNFNSTNSDWLYPHVLRATVITNFATNVTEHWPQKMDGITPNPDYPAYLERHRRQGTWQTLEYCAPEYPHYVDDTNADTKSIEFVVTGRRLLRFEFEGHKELETTNWTQAHYSVDYRRVMTNVWVDLFTNHPASSLFHLQGDGDLRIVEGRTIIK